MPYLNASLWLSSFFLFLLPAPFCTLLYISFSSLLFLHKFSSLYARSPGVLPPFLPHPLFTLPNFSFLHVTPKSTIVTYIFLYFHFSLSNFLATSSPVFSRRLHGSLGSEVEKGGNQIGRKGGRDRTDGRGKGRQVWRRETWRGGVQKLREKEAG